MAKNSKKGRHVSKGDKQTITAKDVAKVPAAVLAAGTQAAAATATATAKAPAPAAPKPARIKVLKTDMNYRGARLAWFQRLKEFDGKTEGEFLADTKERPPALTRNQTAENPTGWVSFFRRQGVLSLQQGT